MKSLQCLMCLAFVKLVNCFTTLPSSPLLRVSSRLSLSLSSPTAAAVQEDDLAIQWDLLQRHHAKGSWKGIWTSYDYIGDVVDEVFASVDLDVNDAKDCVQKTQRIVVGAKRSDCVNCFDSFEVKSLPVALYTRDQLHNSRFASVSIVNGPSLLRSGVMATELVLSHGDGRVRVIFQHAPVWEAGVEPASCPPQGLKLFRTLVSREALRDDPPTPEAEEQNPPKEGNPIFYRTVSPFTWHKKWGGTSWTWGPNTGNRGWAIEEMDDADAWHGRPTGDNANTWALRLPGGILLQGPRVVTDGVAGLCRLAWMPTDNVLLRVEASVMALEPMILDDDSLVGFYPPRLGSLRCDVMNKIGELESDSVLVGDGEEDVVLPRAEAEAVGKASHNPEGDSGLNAIRNSLRL